VDAVYMEQNIDEQEVEQVIASHLW
jgi:hypothetical protein